MAENTFKIESYAIKLGDRMTATFDSTTIKAKGIIACIGTEDHRIIAYFLCDDSPVPPAVITHEGKWGCLFLQKEIMPLWIDLLRNEKPLYGYINTQYPKWTNISTSNEPVGEEES